MGALLSYFFYEEEDAASPSCKMRVANMLRYQYRGVFTVIATILIVIICIFLPMESFDRKNRTVTAIWSTMFVFFLLAPMDYPVTGMMPIVFMPLFAILSTTDVAQCYFGDTLALMLLGGMMSMIVNNTGVDKRICLYILSKGSKAKFSGSWLIFKAGLAAFVNGIVGHRLISCAALYDILSSAQSLDIRDYVNMAVQTSSTIGSLIPLHGSMTILASRAMYYEHDPKKTDFNYFNYALYSVPCAFLMFAANMLYYVSLLKRTDGLTEEEMGSLQNNFQKAANDQPPKNSHQYLAILFMTLYFVSCFLRGYEPKWFNEMSSDATIAVMFVVALHVLPRQLEFLKVFTAKKQEDLPDLKPTSAILWWRYVDKNTPYAYMFLIGGGVSLVKAVKEIQMGISATIPKLAVFVAAPLVSCFISHTAVTVILMPLMSNFGYLDAVIVGLGTSLGFTMPFRYAPAYFCHANAKTPKDVMVRVGIGSTLISGIMLAIFAVVVGTIMPAPAADIPEPTPPAPEY